MTHIDINQLPDDPKLLKDALHRSVSEQDELKQRNELLKHQLSMFQRQRFGSSSEKLPSNQQTFEFADAQAVEDLPDPQAEQREAARQPKFKSGRRPLPPQLPRETIVHELSETERICTCCGKVMEKLGEDVSEQLDIEPAKYKVLRHVRYKYACQVCHDGVRTAPAPVPVVDQGIATSGTIATVIEDKFDDHVPLNRQSNRHARWGLDISRATLCSWVGQGAERLRPVWDYMRHDVVRSAIIWTDDTPVRVQHPGGGKTRTARFWIYNGDDAHPHVVFDFTASRSRDGPEKFLDEFSGYLQADAYAGYDRMCAGPGVRGCGCWAHARRKFFEAKETDSRAHQMLALIRELYAVESAARPVIDDARAKPEHERGAALAQAYALRQQLRELQARPILARIRAWLDTRPGDTLPKSFLAQANTYVLNQWSELVRYVEDGRIEIDNNISERGLRGVAVGRRNWLFLGNDASGERAAILYSIIATCKRHSVNPWLYLKDVLIRISTHPGSKTEELLPQNWQKTFQPA